MLAPDLGEQAVRVEVVCPIPGVGWGGGWGALWSLGLTSMVMLRGVSQVLRNSQEGSPCPVQRAEHEGACVCPLQPRGSSSRET